MMRQGRLAPIVMVAEPAACRLIVPIALTVATTGSDPSTRPSPVDDAEVVVDLFDQLKHITINSGDGVSRVRLQILGFTRVLAPVFGSPFTYCAPASMPG